VSYLTQWTILECGLL